MITASVMKELNHNLKINNILSLLIEGSLCFEFVHKRCEFDFMSKFEDADIKPGDVNGVT